MDSPWAVLQSVLLEIFNPLLRMFSAMILQMSRPVDIGGVKGYVTKSSILVSTNQIQQQQKEPAIIDLESESTSTSLLLSSPIHINNNCMKRKE